MGTTGLYKETEVFICRSCGKSYIVRKCQVQCSHTNSFLNYCIPCQKAFREKQKREQEERENCKWQRKKAEDQKTFETLLPLWNVKNLSDIKPSADSLVILGNGFDLMHGVKSSYYAFILTNQTNSYLLKLPTPFGVMNLENSIL